MQNRFGLIDTGVMSIFMIIALDIVITLRFSINCSVVICSPTYYLLSWEKPLVKHMAPGSIFHHINLPSTSYFWHHLFCNLYFLIYIIKIPKIFILLSLSNLNFASGREGLDNPFIALVVRFLFVCVGTWDLRVASCWIDTFLKTEGNTYDTLLHHAFLFKGKTNASSRGSTCR